MHTSSVGKEQSLVPGVEHKNYVSDDGSIIQEKTQRFGGFTVTSTKEQTRDDVRYYTRGKEGRETRYGTSCQPPRSHMIAHIAANGEGGKIISSVGVPSKGVPTSTRRRSAYEGNYQSTPLSTTTEVDSITTTQCYGNQRKAIVTTEAVAIPCPTVPFHHPPLSPSLRTKTAGESNLLSWLHAPPSRPTQEKRSSSRAPCHLPNQLTQQNVFQDKTSLEHLRRPIASSSSCSHGGSELASRRHYGCDGKTDLSGNDNKNHQFPDVTSSRTPFIVPSPPARNDNVARDNTTHGRAILFRHKSSSSW